MLVAPRNPLNIGAASRAMSNFGFLNLAVVNPYELAFREARSAMGGSEVLSHAQEYGSVAEAVTDCTLVVGTTAIGHREMLHPLHILAEGAQLIRSELEAHRVALLFGTEKFGLSNDDLSHCHWLLHIPTRSEHESMNLGQAVAVCAYELARSFPQEDSQPRKEEAPSASAGKADLITSVLLESLRESGYINAAADDTAEQKVRRLIRRLKLSAQDADLWLGMLRQIAWRLRDGRHQS